MHDHLPLVCFIVCDCGPAIHFAEFARILLVDGTFRIDIYANESTLSKFQDLQPSDNLRLLNFLCDELTIEDEQNLAIKLLNNCVINGAQTIIVDIANKFDIKLQETFHKLDLSSHNIHFWCYYDNPEEYVPGGYSIRSGEMIKLSQNILFANMNLIKYDSKIFSLLNEKNVHGIGYYPIKTAEILQQRREIERKILRRKYGWENIDFIFIYVGGHNKVYYEQAFPIFLSFLSEIDEQSFENILFLIHQHPAAKNPNEDGLFFQQWSLKNGNHIPTTLSHLTTDEVQIIADAILYYQTSMAPQFALLDLPIMQVGHEVYQDVLVKHNLCEIATNSIEFINGLKVLKEKSNLSNQIQQKQLIYDAIGYSSEWSENLRTIVL